MAAKSWSMVSRFKPRGGLSRLEYFSEGGWPKRLKIKSLSGAPIGLRELTVLIALPVKVTKPRSVNKSMPKVPIACCLLLP